MMRRLSYIRTTPEVWEQAIKRMVRLNNLVIKPEEAREILRYLSNNNGLAPEEAKPVFWEAEHRMFRDQSDKIPSDALQHTCNYCHTIGRVLTQRRTKDDYEKLINMHLGLFPGAENTLRPRRPTGPQFESPVAFSAPTGGNPAVASPAPAAANVNLRADGKDPADVAIDYLSKEQPLNARMGGVESRDANSKAGRLVDAHGLSARQRANLRHDDHLTGPLAGGFRHKGRYRVCDDRRDIISNRKGHRLYGL
jgi:hypothetical protein